MVWTAAALPMIGGAMVEGPSAAAKLSAAGAKSGSCNGTVATTCTTGFRKNGYSYDCHVFGGTCATYNDGVQTRAGCNVQSGCTGTAAEGQCNKSTNDLYYCYNGVGIGFTCGLYNATCGYEADPANDAAMTATCFFSLPQCSGGNTSSCNGQIGSLCSGGESFQYNCGALGLNCQTLNDPNPDIACIAPGCTQTDANNCTESCTDATHAQFCVGGAKLSVDCAAQGFSKCTSYNAPPNSTSITTSYVECTP